MKLEKSMLEPRSAWRRSWGWLAGTLLLLSAPTLIYAQAAVATGVRPAVIFTGYHFFAALVAGLILAFAFQLILTDLSVAAGLNVLGRTRALRERSPEQRAARSAAESHEPSAGVQPTLRKVSSAFGLWALITASIALFFAAWFAVGLSLTTSAAIGAIIGMAIWGIFFILLILLESSAALSLVGSLIKLVSNGVRTALGGASSLMGKATEMGSKVSEKLSDVTGSVKEEVFGGMDVSEELKRSLSQAKAKSFDAADFKQKLESRLTTDELNALRTQDSAMPSEDTLMSYLPKPIQSDPDRARGIARAISGTLAQIREGGVQPAGTLGHDVASYKDKADSFLRTAAKAELTPDNVKRTVEKIVMEPKAGGQPIPVRLTHVNRGSLAAALQQRKDVTPDESKKLLDALEQKANELRGKYPQPNVSAIKESLQAKIHDYLDSLNRVNVDFDQLKGLVINFLRDPKSNVDSFSQRFQSMDREKMKTMLSQQANISKEDQDRILQNFDTFRNDITEKTEQMKKEVQARLQEAETKALEQADETRKTAAVAAWWVFGTAVVSGAAAVIGGALGAY